MERGSLAVTPPVICITWINFKKKKSAITKPPVLKKILK